MPSIKFSETELGFLREHYEQELMEAEMYVAEIRKILSKLGRVEKETVTVAPEKKRRGRPAKNPKPVKVEKPVAKKAVKKAKKKSKTRKKAAVVKPESKAPETAS